jgi:hypothetical protein
MILIFFITTNKNKKCFDVQITRNSTTRDGDKENCLILILILIVHHSYVLLPKTISRAARGGRGGGQYIFDLPAENACFPAVKAAENTFGFSPRTVNKLKLAARLHNNNSR